MQKKGGILYNKCQTYSTITSLIQYITNVFTNQKKTLRNQKKTKNLEKTGMHFFIQKNPQKTHKKNNKTHTTEVSIKLGQNLKL